MYKRAFSSLIKALLCGVFLALLINPANAQTKKKTKQNPGMPQGTAQKMRSTTNKQRMAAAIKNADRRAAHMRATGKGVK